MPSKSDEWVELAKRHMNAQLKRHHIGYGKLAGLMAEMGLPETESSIASKIDQGEFPAWFLFAAMRAIGADTLRLE